MRSEKAIITSRREFLSNAVGIALVTGSPWPIRADQAHSMHGQSDSTSNSEGTTHKMSLSWDVFLASSIPAITSDLPPGEKQRLWPPISSTLISGERDAVLIDAPITVEQARSLANWIASSGKNLTTIYASHPIHCIGSSESLSFDAQHPFDEWSFRSKHTGRLDELVSCFSRTCLKCSG